MSSLSSLTHGQLQTFRHVLQEMEVAGVRDLPTARVVVQRELDTRHASITAGKVRVQKTSPHHAYGHCPECGVPLVPGGDVESSFVEDLGLVRVGCRCGWSKIVEAER